MQPLNDLIKNKGMSSPILRGAQAALIVEEANSAMEKILGNEFIKHAEAIYYKDGILGIRVRGTAVASEIRLNKDAIIAKIKEKYGNDIIKNFRYNA